MVAILPKGKFVILKHTDKGPNHFDLILEGHELCPTFQFEDLDLKAGKRIQDHRKKYLTFEGQISPEKGTVAQADCGDFVFESNLLTLNGKINKMILKIVSSDQKSVTRIQ